MVIAESSSVTDTSRAIDSACKAKGGVYAQYGCKTVSWDDAARGTQGGALSCWGGNITDTRLWAKSGKLLYTCRSDNWNEKLGKVNAHRVALVVEKEPGRLEPITLADYLKNAGLYGSYAGLKDSTDLYNEKLDQEISIRFQTTFLPVPDGQEFPSVEFCSEAYNYNTTSDDDPRNAVLLCTTQGTAFSQDGAGVNKLFHHSVDESGSVHRYWLEAEQTKHKVGGEQKETKEEAQAAAVRGKATASVIGVPEMGTRFNVLMCIQVPLKQQESRFTANPSVDMYGGGDDYYDDDGDGWEGGAVDMFGGFGEYEEDESEECCPDEEPCDYECEESGGNGFGINAIDAFYSGLSSSPGIQMLARPGRKKAPGTANAARVSRGSEVEGPLWGGVKKTSPERDTCQHATVTIVLYNTVAGGVPSVEDVQAAIDDMEELYKSCSWTGALSEEGANFMKSELTEKDAVKILTKVVTQPYKPEGLVVENGNTFPTSQTAL